MRSDQASPRPDHADGPNPAPATPESVRSWHPLWLPRPVYAAIPWIYLGSGTLTLLGGLYLPDWAWPVPYAILFGLACLHTGLRIASMRQRTRQRHAATRQMLSG